jgi:hypothetical protein
LIIDEVIPAALPAEAAAALTLQTSSPLRSTPAESQ